MIMKNIKKTILITLALLITNGCSGFLNNEKHNYFTSQVNLKDSKLTPIITNDMVNFIQNYYPVSKTTFYFQLDSSAYKQGIVIENALRNVGYGISYIKKKGQIAFAYKIDFISENIIRTTYNIGKSTLSRLYNIEGGNISPRSAFTTRGLKKHFYPLKFHPLSPAITSLFCFIRYENSSIIIISFSLDLYKEVINSKQSRKEFSSIFGRLKNFDKISENFLMLYR